VRGGLPIGGVLPRKSRVGPTIFLSAMGEGVAN